MPVSACGELGGSCFVGGTQIVVGMEFTGGCTCHTTEEWKHESDCGVSVYYVTVSIEDIKVGDLVYSYDTLHEIDREIHPH